LVITKMIFGKKAAMRVRQGEELMQALATTVKDIIVIKSGMVTLGNMLSNVVLLSMKGVPIQDILKGHKDSYVAMKAYKDANQAVEQVKLTLRNAKLSPAKRANLEVELVRLEDELSSNPVIRLVDQGLLSTIVEDIDVEAQEYRLRDRVKRKGREAGISERFDDAVNKIPKGLREAGKEALVLQGSNLYEFLSESAQFSDFGARYVLFNKLIKDGISEDEAAGKVMDVFIDYDLPTHKGIQYLNDMGLLMFSKYLIRVQKIILQTVAENPGRFMVWTIFQNFFGDVSDITDSAIGIETNPMTRWANPISSFLDVSNDIITAKAVGL